MPVAPPSEVTRPRALITGRSGFTGRYVEAELEAAGYEVCGLTRIIDGQEVPVDLLDKAAVREVINTIAPTAVLHLAAIAFVAHGDVDAIYRVNVVGTRNLLEALALLPKAPEVVVLASSANVYGNADVEPITEDTPPAPANDYAVSKLAMEYMARLWMDKLPIVIARPFNYTGVGQSEQFLIPKIIGSVRKKESVIELGNINVARDFSDVRDVAAAYKSIVTNPRPGLILNICSGDCYALSEVLQMAMDLTGHQIEVKVNPKFVRSNDVARLVGSNFELKNLFGWQKKHSVPDTVAWMLSA